VDSSLGFTLDMSMQKEQGGGGHLPIKIKLIIFLSRAKLPGGVKRSCVEESRHESDELFLALLTK